jgi:hypothetical protein
MHASIIELIIASGGGVLGLVAVVYLVAMAKERLQGKR